MAKVSIGLRGWRFEESEVFTEAGDWRPIEEMPDDAGKRVQRLTALVNTPCDACWLVHGDEDVARCNVSTVVYGEPMAEVTLCDDHERDFLYWYREAGGREYRGSEDLPDAFYDWFEAGGGAPDGYAGVEHVETDPEAVPDPSAPGWVEEASGSGDPADDAGGADAVDAGDADDARDDADAGDDADADDARDDADDTATAPDDVEDLDAEDLADLDLSRDYPT